MNYGKIVFIYEISHRDVIENLLSAMKEYFSGSSIWLCEVSTEKPGHVIFSEIEKYNPDLLFSFALAGFSWTTLTEQISYNLLGAKQAHILIGDYDEYDEYLRKEYAINLFFYVDNKKWIERYQSVYTGIEYMKKIPMLNIGKKLTDKEKKDNKQIIYSVLGDFINEIK